MSSSPALNGVRPHQGRSRSEAIERSSAMDMYADSPRSMGASPPEAALIQEASRNSALVASSSRARVRMRSGSQPTTIAFFAR